MYSVIHENTHTHTHTHTLHTLQHPQVEPSESDDALDARGVPGWDKVDRLAKALINIQGLSISNAQAKHIKELYDALLDFDKKPVTFSPRPMRPPRGRFARSKSYRVGSVGREQVKRCFLSAGLPSCSPSKSRVVEAICLHLCDRHPQAKTTVSSSGKRQSTSRWKLIISDYTSIRNRLCNSYRLLEDTNITLFNINETTLVGWYKNAMRRDEIKMLMQGISSPSATHTSDHPLPPPTFLPPGPPPAPLETHHFEEPEDTTGQARVRGQQRPPSAPPAPQIQPASRTTEWRQRQRAASLASGSASSSASGSASSSASVSVPPTQPPPPPTTATTKQRKVYSCRICGKPMTSPGHTQFRGQRYCPDEPGQMSKEEWLMLKKIEARAKAAAQQQ